MKTMKTINKLKFNHIEDLGSGVEVAHMTLDIKINKNYDFSQYVTLSSTGVSLRIHSSLLTHEIYHLMKWLDEKDEDDVSNEIKIMRYAKEMIKANKKLKTVESF